MKSVLILSEGWPNNIRLVLDLTLGGFAPHLLVVDPRGAFLPFAASFPVESVADLDALRARLPALAATGAFDLVWALSEQTLIAAWACEPALGGRVVSDVAPPLRPLFADKGAMIDFARGLGVPTPPQRRIPLGPDMAEVLAGLDYPCVIKGEQGQAGAGVHFAADPQQARAAVAAEMRRRQSRPTAQAFLSGDVVMVGVLARDGRPVAMHGWRQIARSTAKGPPIAVAPEANPRIFDHARRMLEALDYTGFADVEFIEHDGDYVFIDLNPRPWGSFYALESLGVNVANLLRDFFLGTAIAEPDRPRRVTSVAMFPQYFHTHRPTPAAIADFLRRDGLRQAPWRHPGLLLWHLSGRWRRRGRGGKPADSMSTGLGGGRGRWPASTV